MKFRAALFILIVSTTFAQQAAGSMATFENYPETPAIKAPFVDPASGITFSNPQNSAGYFGIDYGTATANLADLPGNLLGGDGVQLGNAFGLTQNFGFDAKLPATALSVAMDMVYLDINTSAGSISLIGLSAAGTQVAATTITPTVTSGGGYLQAHLVLQSTSTPISSFTVRTSNLASAFDNINVVAAPAPEPGTLPLAVILFSMALLLPRRRRQAVRSSHLY